ncbi:MAG: PilZ domain-containing protein [Desulfobacterales bacterium]|jgi:hypothetical protein
MQERRQSERLNYRTTARLANGEATWESDVLNISAEGMFLATRPQFTIGDQVEIEFRLRHSRHAISMSVEIKRIEDEGVGVRILGK